VPDKVKVGMVDEVAPCMRMWVGVLVGGERDGGELARRGTVGVG
jgi:hypothetical protein